MNKVLTTILLMVLINSLLMGSVAVLKVISDQPGTVIFLDNRELGMTNLEANENQFISTFSHLLGIFCNVSIRKS